VKDHIMKNPNLNKDAIDKTIARIRKNQNFKFNMGDWGASGSPNFDENDHYCGTSACIAGFAVLADGAPVETSERRWDGKLLQVDVIDQIGIAKSARDILGLEYDEAQALFMPNCAVVEKGNGTIIYGPDCYTATEDQGIRVLEHLRDTGEVNWRVSGIEKGAEPGFFERWQEVHGEPFHQ
jgi:hypothetical protein